MDTLNGYSNLAEDPHFKARIAELLTLKVRHLETEGPHQVVVEQGGGGGGEVRGHQAGERSSFHGKDIFLFIVSVLVAHCWFISFSFHFELILSNLDLRISLSCQI